MIFVDSNVFLIDLRYPRDKNARVNKEFLSRLKRQGDGVTSTLNLLEVLGVLSFNLNPRQLENMFRLFGDRYGISVLPGSEVDELLPRWQVGRLLQRISKRLSLGDALILEHAETPQFRVQTMVSWEAPHFQGKTSLKVISPAEFLA